MAKLKNFLWITEQKLKLKILKRNCKFKNKWFNLKSS